MRRRSAELSFVNLEPAISGVLGSGSLRAIQRDHRRMQRESV
jgi:hypothetical protein